MTNPIFFGDPAQVAAANPGDTFRLEGPEARHAVSVKRISAGENVDIVDGAGRRLTGTVSATGPSLLELSVEHAAEEPPAAVRFILVQALAKGDRDEQAVEAATELGVDHVIPWQSDRSIVRWKTEKAVKGQAKWQALTTAAAKQSRRAWIPGVEPVLDSRGLARRLADTDLVLVLHEEADAPLADAVRNLPGRSADATGRTAAPAEIAIVVGPEGGISAAELELLRGAGALAVRLGPHVLRSSTAGPAALAVLNQLLGRW